MAGATLAGAAPPARRARPASSAAGAASAAGDLPRADLRGFVCHNALDPADRSMSVTAVMRPVAGTQKLQLKFDLLVSEHGGAGDEDLAGGNLGVWLTPKNPTLGPAARRRLELHQVVVRAGRAGGVPVPGLVPLAGPDGKVLGTAQRSARRCSQRELRPDLMVVEPDRRHAGPGHPSQDTYTAVIAQRRGDRRRAVRGRLSALRQSQRDQTSDQSSAWARYSQRTAFRSSDRCARPPARPTIIADSTHQVPTISIRPTTRCTATCAGGERRLNDSDASYPS